jgi:UTP--glucose-1-phosphate uridylyltransferase
VPGPDPTPLWPHCGLVRTRPLLQASSPPMNIRKAVITAAGSRQRTLPLQSLVDRDGQSKTALAILLGEAVSAGIEEVGMVVHPGDESAFRNAAGEHAGCLRFISQPEPRGYGHAVSLAGTFTGQEAFLLMVGDHIYVSSQGQSCARQLVEVARSEKCAVSAVQATHESKLPLYGAIGGRRVHGRQSLYEVHQVLEKPSPTEAEQHLMVPGLRSGRYLCFFGMHVLTPLVMRLLEEQVAGEKRRSDPIPLSPTLDRLSQRERYLGFEADGRRYDLGQTYGLLTAQLALGLAGADRDEILTQLVDLLARGQQGLG